MSGDEFSEKVARWKTRNQMRAFRNENEVSLANFVGEIMNEDGTKGVSSTTGAKWEKGDSHPKYFHMREIARLCGVTGADNVEEFDKKWRAWRNRKPSFVTA